ncbi:MAG: flagellar biosynthetic protein FliO [Thermodesulfobacteriota bacterium]|nr:flagellar biosynthetic protein FliO [Thermodesulfobacteriota bacterium]
MRLLIISLFFSIQPVYAAAANAEPSLLGSSLKMVAALAIVIGILLLLYAASRKGFGVLPQKKNGLIQVLETRPLGGRKFLCVVKVRGEEMLLGLSNDRIEYLTKVPSSDKFAETLQQAEKVQS